MLDQKKKTARHPFPPPRHLVSLSLCPLSPLLSHPPQSPSTAAVAPATGGAGSPPRPRQTGFSQTHLPPPPSSASAAALGFGVRGGARVRRLRRRQFSGSAYAVAAAALRRLHTRRRCGQVLSPACGSDGGGGILVRSSPPMDQMRREREQRHLLNIAVDGCFNLHQRPGGCGSGLIRSASRTVAVAAPLTGASYPSPLPSSPARLPLRPRPLRPLQPPLPQDTRSYHGNHFSFGRSSAKELLLDIINLALD
ncbi:unnamed protein product [Urochloa humidicola]